MYYIKEKRYIETLKRDAMHYIAFPDDYESSTKKYPVLYMHDGHNLFDVNDSFMQATWEIIEAYQKNKDLPEIIIVGIECAPGVERSNEYGPYTFEFVKSGFDSQPGGKGDRYIKYIIENLKPYIDQTYRVLKEPDYTGIMGSSMGGVISLYAGIHYPNVFGLVGSLSGAFFVSIEALSNDIINSQFDSLSRCYIDVGTKEIAGGGPEDYISSNDRVYKLLSKQLSNQQLKYEVIEGGKHHEKDWSQRFPSIIRYLFQRD